jgi:hypothetical protein
MRLCSPPIRIRANEHMPTEWAQMHLAACQVTPPSNATICWSYLPDNSSPDNRCVNCPPSLATIVKQISLSIIRFPFGSDGENRAERWTDSLTPCCQVVNKQNCMSLDTLSTDQPFLQHAQEIRSVLGRRGKSRLIGGRHQRNR